MIKYIIATSENDALWNLRENSDRLYDTKTTAKDNIKHPGWQKVVKVTLEEVE